DDHRELLLIALQLALSAARASGDQAPVTTDAERYFSLKCVTPIDRGHGRIIARRSLWSRVQAVL
ncbi:MAG: hypothetical protein ACRENC_10790, partial [Gemmatimonadaceae bacterium]